ncbi:hypothetical protein [Aliirhizobium smilacinae]|uniref:Uncharacterized protein n=1 Tax=Aliirhizobium smilacinae TaxID=1395944 RepID=A0A5C4X9U9_9HYPH|nr:hypothetical protein [Rhizobium smilacinae]TNM59601.1 hypothetical protein FHP24_28205 [Rhizobium smilacinae]
MSVHRASLEKASETIFQRGNQLVLVTGAVLKEAHQPLAEDDVAVLFMTNDPGALYRGFQDALRVMRKPVMDPELVEPIQYVADRGKSELQDH